MSSEPVIKSYLPLDDEDKIEDDTIKEQAKEPSERFSLEEEREYAVGLTTIICIFVIGMIVLAWYLIGHLNQKQESVQEVKEIEQLNSEVLGAQENQTTPAANQVSPSTLYSETYTVESGDTLYAIGNKLKIDWEEIAKANDLERPYNLKVGQKLKIPK